MIKLIDTNPYLRNKEIRESSNYRSARTSCGVEGIVEKTNMQKIEIDSTKTKEVFSKIQLRLKCG